MFPVSRGMSRYLCCLRSAVSGLFQLLFDLARTRAGGVQVLLRVPFDLGRPTPPSLDFVAQPRQPKCQLRLIHGCRKLLGVEEAALLKRSCLSVFPLSDIEDHGMGMKLGSC